MPVDLSIHIRSCQSYFLSSCLATQLAVLVISAVCRWENAWSACLCATEFKCGRGIEHSGVRRGFANYGSKNVLCELRWACRLSPQKAPFVLRTIEEQMEMIRGSEPRSLIIRLIQRVPFYQKGTKNIVLKPSEFIALNLRLHFLWHSYVHRQRNQ